MKPVIFHAEAEAELLRAIMHYDRQRAGLGREFQEEVEAAVERVRRDPQTYALQDQAGTRACMVRRFPYTLYYVELDDRIWVAAVAHHRRRLRYWARRRPE